MSTTSANTNKNSFESKAEKFNKLMKTFHSQDNMTELITLVHWAPNSSTPDKIKTLIKKIGVEYLNEKYKNIPEDWPVFFPNYLRIYSEFFSEGHELFNLFQENLDIVLTDLDVIYLLIKGIFWKYYYDTKIINYAIEEFKKCDRYMQITRIPYTPEIGLLLDITGVSKDYSYFKELGETCGYFNAQWLCDPKTYDKELDKLTI
jgi:hypothetical protein